jgi:phenylalanyl-tRNA synthetase beta chain
MLNMLAYNLNRDVENVRLFEAGNVFAHAQPPKQSRHICIGATGNVIAPGVHESARIFSFFDLKGDIETLLDSFEHRRLTYEQNASDYYREGYSARVLIDNQFVAQFGEISPEVAASRKLRQGVFVGEVFLDLLFEHELRQPTYKPLPQYPAAERDFSFIFSDSIVFEKLEQSIHDLSLRELRRFTPVEIFRGGSIPSGQYSVLLRAKFQSAERTLREDEVAQWTSQIVGALQKLGGKQRA